MRWEVSEYCIAERESQDLFDFEVQGASRLLHMGSSSRTAQSLYYDLSQSCPLYVHAAPCASNAPPPLTPSNPPPAPSPTPPPDGNTVSHLTPPPIPSRSPY